MDDAESKKCRADQMRRLPEEKRMDAIAASPNVVGYERFADRNQQVALRGRYRAPVKPGPGGTA